MKKSLIVLLVSLLAVFSAAAAVFATTYFTTGFEELDIDSIADQDGWIVFNGYGLVTNVTAKEGEQSLEVKAQANAQSNVERKIEGITEKQVWVDFWAISGTFWNFYIGESFSAIGAVFYVQGGMIGCLDGDGVGSGKYQSAGKISGTWNRYTVMIDFERSKWEFYLNGKRILKDLNFRHSWTENVTWIRFLSNSGATKSLFVDNVTVSSEKPAGIL